MAKPKSNIQTWFQWFVAWVQDFIRKAQHKDERQLLVLELLKSRNGLAFAESVQRNTPGAVSTWYITHTQHPNSHVIITLDNLIEVKKFLTEPLPEDTVYISRTHLISVQWLIKVGEKKKQVYKFKGAWLGDFQGRTQSINAKAADVVRYVVLEVINLLPLASMSWETRLDKYGWEDEIVSKCKIIADNHKPHLKKIKKPELVG